MYDFFSVDVIVCVCVVVRIIAIILLCEQAIFPKGSVFKKSDKKIWYFILIVFSIHSEFWRFLIICVEERAVRGSTLDFKKQVSPYRPMLKRFRYSKKKKKS